jgi:hypothetical protein
MIQLRLPIVTDIDPRIQLDACRRLAKMVRENRNSYETRRYRRRRAAALRGLRRKALS